MREYDYREKWQKLLTPEIVKKLTLINGGLVLLQFTQEWAHLM